MTLAHRADTTALRSCASRLDALARRSSDACSQSSTWGTATSGHSSYLHDRTTSQHNIAQVVMPFSGLGGVSFTVRGGTSADAFDMARWSDVEAIADAVAAEEEFTADKVVLVDEPDHKKVTWIDEHGAELEIGAQKALVPAVYGACVLP